MISDKGEGERDGGDVGECVACCCRGCEVLRDAALCCVMLRDAGWCCVVLRDAAWCCVVLRDVMVFFAPSPSCLMRTYCVMWIPHHPCIGLVQIT